MCLKFTIYIKIILVFYFNICFSQYSNIPKNIKTIILKNPKSIAPYINLEDSIELSFDIFWNIGRFREANIKIKN